MTRPKEFYFKEGCFIEEWHNSAQDQHCSVARVRVAAHSTTKLHALRDTTERYVILAGEGRVWVDHQPAMVGEGDVVVIHADVAQKIENVQSSDLIFLAICQPRFQAHNYYELENDTPPEPKPASSLTR